ncbi:leucine-rich repeat domain-containing protein [Planococcus alpniumensis]|uniref:leucine-rich repeat domain-containing protein n=1 Tax=Planococcus alpniumensis TaxID=2708345 RepID=UPI001B8CF462|nr:leucine-rich repeat domain-containing protein [Planococcus sp. MSAK28401]
MNYFDKDPQYLFRIDNRPVEIEDLNDIDQSSEEIVIYGKTKGIDLLASFSHLKKLWICSVNQQEFDQILSQVNPEMLSVYNMRVENLSLLSTLSNLQTLSLEWNTKASSLWDVSKNTYLNALSIEGFSKIRDIEPLMQGNKIEYLNLQGDQNNTLKIQTLEPLKYLQQLKYLGLSFIKVEDESLKPISYLKGLKVLAISNQFPTEEYAKLSVDLPETKCSKFAAYERLHQAISGMNIMVVGKRKPNLNLQKDAEKVKKYENQFKELQKAYKKVNKIG